MLCKQLIYWSPNWAVTSLCTAATEQCVWDNQYDPTVFTKQIKAAQLAKRSDHGIGKLSAVNVCNCVSVEQGIHRKEHSGFKQSKEKNRQKKNMMACPVYLLTIKSRACSCCRRCGHCTVNTNS